jgi:hypothetical protein
MSPLKKGQLREEDRYMWGCGLRPHPHIYPSVLLAGGFFSALMNNSRYLSAEDTMKTAIAHFTEGFN